MKIGDIDDVFVVEVNSHDERWHIERLRVIVERNQKCLIEKRLRCWVPIAFADTFDGALAIKRCLKNITVKWCGKKKKKPEQKLKY